VYVKEMPFKEKLEGILSMKKLLEDFTTPLVLQELGKEELIELQSIWHKETIATPSDSSDELKYEVAYKNFLQQWITANNFMIKYGGDVGMAKFVNEAIAGWKRKYSGSGRQLKILWALSPKSAFKRLSSTLAYKLQMFSPFTVSELNENHMIITVPTCKMLQNRDTNDFCLNACQNIIPAWLESEFNVKMDHNRKGQGCVVTFTPFNSK